MKKKVTEPVEAVSAPAKEVSNTSEIEAEPTPLKDKEGHYIGHDGDRLFTRNEVTTILKVRFERHDASLLRSLRCKDFDEVSDLVDFARSVLHIQNEFMTSDKETYDNAILNYRNVEKPLLNKKMFKGCEWGLNTYATYYNVNVRVLLDENGYPKPFIDKSTVKYCYLFVGDPIPEDSKTAIMPFSDFYKLVCESNVEHFSHYLDHDYPWHKDAYDSFTKEALDEFFKTAKPEDKDKYIFLFKIRRLAKKD